MRAKSFENVYMTNKDYDKNSSAKHSRENARALRFLKLSPFSRIID